MVLKNAKIGEIVSIHFVLDFLRESQIFLKEHLVITKGKEKDGKIKKLNIILASYFDEKTF